MLSAMDERPAVRLAYDEADSLAKFEIPTRGVAGFCGTHLTTLCNPKPLISLTLKPVESSILDPETPNLRRCQVDKLASSSFRITHRLLFRLDAQPYRNPLRELHTIKKCAWSLYDMDERFLDAGSHSNLETFRRLCVGPNPICTVLLKGF